MGVLSTRGPGYSVWTCDCRSVFQHSGCHHVQRTNGSVSRIYNMSGGAYKRCYCPRSILVAAILSDLRVSVRGRGVRTVVCGLGHPLRHSRALPHQEHRLVHVPEARVGV